MPRVTTHDWMNIELCDGTRDAGRSSVLIARWGALGIPHMAASQRERVSMSWLWRSSWKRDRVLSELPVDLVCR